MSVRFFMHKSLVASLDFIEELHKIFKKLWYYWLTIFCFISAGTQQAVQMAQVLAAWDRVDAHKSMTTATKATNWSFK